MVTCERCTVATPEQTAAALLLAHSQVGGVPIPMPAPCRCRCEYVGGERGPSGRSAHRLTRYHRPDTTSPSNWQCQHHAWLFQGTYAGRLSQPFSLFPVSWVIATGPACGESGPQAAASCSSSRQPREAFHAQQGRWSGRVAGA